MAKTDDPVAAGLESSDDVEPTKSAKTILRQEISIGAEQLERRSSGLMLSAVSGGLDIGFGPAMMAAILALAPHDDLATRLLVAFVYSIGFVIVILGRSELFTEHTTLAVFPLLSGETTVVKLARLWGLVYAGNLIGALTFSAGAAPLGIALDVFAAPDLADLAHEITDHASIVILGSGVAAGWMMGLVSWLVTAARDTIGQVVIIVLVTGAIGLLGLHHSIAGSVEVLLGVFGADIPVTEFLRFLGLATLGNAIGGVVFVAALKYGHSTQPGPSEV